MRAPAHLRPEIASVCRFLPAKRAPRFVRPLPRTGVLAELAGIRGVP